MASTFNSHPDLKVSAKFTIGTEAANAINVAVQLVDRKNGNEIGERVSLGWYLAGDANGDSVASATTGGIAIGTDGLLLEWTANVSGLVVSESDGDIDVTITDTGTPTVYLALVMPDGKVEVSGAITFA
jgi:hypothetical protein